MADSNIGEGLWTAAQAAAYLHVTDDVLYRWRLSGEGPPFLIVPGRQKYRYRPVVVRQWAAESEVPSMAAFNEARTKRALVVAKQRESLARARQSRWRPKLAET
jgi:hypothetical protein